MAFRLDEFIGQHGKDFARGYTFYFIPPLTFMSENDKYLVMSSALPASTIGAVEANWQGNVYKLGTTHEYAEISVSFHVDPQASIRAKLVEWANKIHNRITNAHGDPGIYMQDFRLQHVNHYTGSPIMEYIIKKAWPSTVGELSLDYASKDLATFDVTFTYQWFETA